jgi:oxaloacetate decarboxylase alpha subunit
MNIKEIKEIIELMKENNINELEMQRDGLKIALKRGPSGVFVQSPVVEIPSHTAVSHVPAKEVSHPPEEAPKKNVSHIVSPMVGTFYTAPSPEAAPYVHLGDDVKEGDVICIVEAMKVMNEIKAEVRGKIKNILVKNGESIEFSQPLFEIEKF